MFCSKGVLRNFAKFTGKHLLQSLFFNKVAGVRPATVLEKVFSCEFGKISKNILPHRTPLVAASADRILSSQSTDIVVLRNFYKSIQIM